MAVSLATSLVPYLGSGNPYVVVTGKFVLGCVIADGLEVKLAHRLDLAGLASGSGTFSLTVSGRGSGLSDYVATGLTSTLAGSFAVDTDVPRSVRMLDLPLDDRSYDSVGSAERSSYRAQVGRPVSTEVTIVLRGRVDNLDLSQVRAHAVDVGTGTIYDVPADGASLQYAFPDYGTGTGWRLYGVHAYDQPFRTVSVPEYFTNAGKRVYWD